VTETEAMNKPTDRQSGLAELKEICFFGTLEMIFRKDESWLNQNS
jgi:hypothetical protein